MQHESRVLTYEMTFQQLRPASGLTRVAGLQSEQSPASALTRTTSLCTVACWDVGMTAAVPGRTSAARPRPQCGLMKLAFVHDFKDAYQCGTQFGSHEWKVDPIWFTSIFKNFYTDKSDFWQESTLNIPKFNAIVRF